MLQVFDSLQGSNSLILVGNAGSGKSTIVRTLTNCLNQIAANLPKQYSKEPHVIDQVLAGTIPVAMSIAGHGAMHTGTCISTQPLPEKISLHVVYPQALALKEVRPSYSS